MTEQTNQIAVVEEKPIAATPETAQILKAIVHIASNQDIEIERIEKLMDIKERIESSEAKKLFAADYAAMKPELPTVARTKNNAQTKSKYAPLEDINQAIDPILAKYGFATSTEVVAQTETTVTVKAELLHRSGHFKETTLTMPIDDRGIAGTVNKTKVHAIASSITYIKRIAICALLNISTGDDVDGNLRSGFISIEQAAEIDNKLNEVGADKAVFLKYMGVADVREIPVSKYSVAMVSIAKAFAKKGGK